MAELKSYSGKFYEVSVAVREPQDDGTEKIVKKTVVVDALTFGDAENTATIEMQPEEVVNINPAQYKEVFLSRGDDGDDKFYKCKLELIMMDEKTMKEKRTKTVYLVQAKSLNRALRYLDDMMRQSAIDYDSVVVVGTSVVEVFLHDREDKPMPTTRLALILVGKSPKYVHKVMELRKQHECLMELKKEQILELQGKALTIDYRKGECRLFRSTPLYYENCNGDTVETHFSYIDRVH